MTTLTVSAIEHGTVIDHIESGRALQIVELLRLSTCTEMLTIGLHLPSPTLGTKDVIKIANRALTPQECAQVAIISARATVNIIANYSVAKKFHPEPPDMIRGFRSCPNPRCLTHVESASSAFRITPTQLICLYCEQATSR